MIRYGQQRRAHDGPEDDGGPAGSWGGLEHQVVVIRPEPGEVR